jgi:hypothetical protein
MFIIQKISDRPRQKQNLTLPDGTFISLSIYFIDQQQGWFITNLTYGTFILNGMRITNGKNILHQFRNQIPFGMACISNGDREPMLIQDFITGNSKLYILTAAEVLAYTVALSG